MQDTISVWGTDLGDPDVKQTHYILIARLNLGHQVAWDNTAGPPLAGDPPFQFVWASILPSFTGQRVGVDYWRRCKAMGGVFERLLRTLSLAKFEILGWLVFRMSFGAKC